MGHDRERFLHVPPELVCPTCLEVLKDPVKVCVEDHIFCRACYSEYQNEQTFTRQVDTYSGRPINACGICRGGMVMKGDRTQSAKFIARLVGALKITCENKDFGCEWIGDVANEPHHLVTCPNRLIDCMNGVSLSGRVLLHEEYTFGADDSPVNSALHKRCGTVVRAHKLMDHKRKRCKFQQLVCPRAGKACVFMRKDKDDHEVTCAFQECQVDDCPTIGTLASLQLHEPACRSIHEELVAFRLSASFDSDNVRLRSKVAEYEESLKDLVRCQADLEEKNIDLQIKLEATEADRERCLSDFQDFKEEMEVEEECWGLHPDDFLSELQDANREEYEAFLEVDDRIATRDETIAQLEEDLREAQGIKLFDVVQLTKRVPADHGITIGKRRREGQEEEEEDVKPKTPKVGES